MQDTIDQPQAEVKLLIETDFGKGNEGNLGPESLADSNSVKDVADPRYVEQLRAERWFCMDDGLEELGGQLPGGIMITEGYGATMSENPGYRRQSELVAATTKELVADGIEVWVHGDNHAGQEGCAANKHWRGILQLGGRTPDVIAPTVWAFMEGLDLGHAAKRSRIRDLIMTGAKRAEDESFWDISPGELVRIAVANGAKYHELEREHKTACTRVDLSPNIFDNHKFRTSHQTHDGLPLGAFSITLGAYKNNLLQRAEKHGYDEAWIANKVMEAAIFTVASSKKLGSPDLTRQLRLAVVGSHL